MESSKNLFKTTIIYFVGTFGSKLLIFFLLPLYSEYLSTEQFGTVNLLTNILPLIGPLFTLQISDCIFRFLCDVENEEQQKKYITNSFLLFIIGMITFIILYLPLVFFVNFEFKFLFLFYFIFNYLGIYMQQVLRGLHKSVDYVITGIFSTLVQLIINIAFITIIFERSILLASLISSSIICIYVLFKINFFKYISIKYVDKKYIKEMMNYGIPLIPNQISWWFNGTAGLYILKYFCDEDVVGLVSFANKFPALITTINNIFLLAWTECTICGYNDKKMSKYFSDMLSKYTIVVIVMSTLMLPAVKVYYEYFISVEYIDSLKLIPILLISLIFNSVATFKGVIYTASKQTKGALKTTIVAAMTNLILAIILIPRIGLYGYVISNMIGNIFFYIVRKESVNKILKIEEKYSLYIIPTFLLIMTIIAIYYFSTMWNIVIECVLVITLSIVYKKEIMLIIDKLKEKLISRNK